MMNIICIEIQEIREQIEASFPDCHRFTEKTDIKTVETAIR